MDYSEPESQAFKLRTELPSPVGRVFNVIRRLNPESRGQSLTLLSQPVEPPGLSAVRGTYGDHEKDVFINCTESGDWYVLSETMYPFVTSGAKRAASFLQDFTDASTPRSEFTLAQQKTALVGVHTVESMTPQELTIGGPVSNTAVDLPAQRAVGAPASESSTYWRLVTNDGQRSWKVSSILIYAILLLCAFGVAAKQRMSSKQLTTLEDAQGELAPVRTDGPTDLEGMMPELARQLDAEAAQDIAQSSTMDRVDQSANPIAQVQFQEPERSLQDQQEPGVPALEKKRAHRGKRGGKGRSKRAASVDP